MLKGERSTKLCLTARTFEKDDQLAGDRQRCRPAEIRLDERQGQIYAGGNAGRGPETAVPNENRIRFEMHRRKSAGKFCASPPMRDSPPAIEETGGRQ